MGNLASYMYVPTKQELLKFKHNENNIKKNINLIYFFECLCYYGKTDIIKENIKYIKTNQLSIYLECCSEYGYLESVLELYEESVHRICPIDLFQNHNFLFKLCCHNQQLSIMEWIYDKSLENNVNIDIKNLMIFDRTLIKWCSSMKKTKSLKWICKKVTLNNSDVKDLYKNSCCYNLYRFMKWLFKHYKVNIRFDNDYCFKTACQNNYIKIAKFLREKCDDYVLELENNHIETFNIISIYSKFLEDNDIEKIIKKLHIKMV